MVSCLTATEFNPARKRKETCYEHKKHEKYDVNFANTERLKMGSFITMQTLVEMKYCAGNHTRP